MTCTRSQSPATTPRSWVIITSAVPESTTSSREQLEDLRLDRDVEGGGRLVGDEQPRRAGQRHRDQRALPHAAGELVRVLARAAAAGRGCRPGRAARPPPPAASFLRHVPVLEQHLGDLGADRDGRVQRGQRVLEDHRHVRAAQPAQRRGRSRRAAPARRTGPTRSPATPRSGSRPMIASEVTDLPQPDSPTRPIVSPGATAKLTPSTARVRCSPVRVKVTASSSTSSTGVVPGRRRHG